MKLFEMPKAELIKFAVADVITTSGGCGDDCDDDECDLDGMETAPGFDNCA